MYGCIGCVCTPPGGAIQVDYKVNGALEVALIKIHNI